MSARSCVAVGAVVLQAVLAAGCIVVWQAPQAAVRSVASIDMKSCPDILTSVDHLGDAMTPEAKCETVQQSPAEAHPPFVLQPDPDTNGVAEARTWSWSNSLEYFAPFGQLMCPGWAA